MIMAFLLNKATLIIVTILMIIALCWALSTTRGKLKEAERELGLFVESESLKVDAYKKYQIKIEELTNKVKLYKEKLHEIENNPDNIEWLETDIPSDIDKSLPR